MPDPGSTLPPGTAADDRPRSARLLCFTHQFRYVEHLATFCNVR
jgi:hypothetical protein